MSKVAPRGFTLIELLIAIALMALMAALSWRGFEGMSRAQQHLAQRADDLLGLQAALAQWQTDLDALAEQPNSPSLDWNGRTLRILRRSSEASAGWQVVAWSHRVQDGAGVWLRWASQPFSRHAQWQQAWLEAARWGQNPGALERAREVRLLALDGWQIYYHRNNAWSHPLSSADPENSASSNPQSGLPRAIRLVLQLTPGQALSGAIELDWARFGAEP